VRSLLLAVAGFAAMEPVTAGTHRFVMHGVGLRLHRSHHRRNHGGMEANDAYPVMFGAIVCLGLWVGFNAPNWSDLVPIGVGITLYGMAYALVHDVYIHRRVRLLGDRRITLLDHLANAHALHHRFNGAPYGMLAPIVPSEIRQRIQPVIGTSRSSLAPLRRPPDQ